MYKLVCFVPKDHLEPLKSALFAAGAGQQDDYEQCCWQVLGQGQFRPKGDANPFIGTLNTLEQVAEYRVEMLCDERFITQAVAALKDAHPYESPAFDVIKLEVF